MKNSSAPCGCRAWFVAGDHVLERLLREDLRLVEHLDVDLVEATAETLLASAEHDDRPVAERDLLLTVRRPDVRDVRGDLLARANPASTGTCSSPSGSGAPSTAPSGRGTGCTTPSASADQERLRDLPRDAQHDPADRRRVLPVRPLREDRPAGAVLPLVERRRTPRTVPHRRPTRRTIPDGRTTCRATSDSRPGLVGGRPTLVASCSRGRRSPRCP
jgi:hypothetical protein